MKNKKVKKQDLQNYSLLVTNKKKPNVNAIIFQKKNPNFGLCQIWSFQFFKLATASIKALFLHKAANCVLNFFSTQTQSRDFDWLVIYL